MAEEYTLETGRAYIHKRCGLATVILDDEFSGLCDPSQVSLGTICSNCGGPDSLSAFRWEDTNEPIHEYRKRLRRTAPGIYQFWRRISPVIGVVGGGTLGHLYFGRSMLVNLTVGISVGLFVMWLIIAPAIARNFGTKFYKQK